MKKRYFLIFCLLLFLFGGTVSASSGSEGTGSLVITDENRYDPAYYQKPEKRYPVSGAKARSARAELDLETYIVGQLQQFQTIIDVSEYQIPETEAGAAFFQILDSHPELFYVNGSINWKYDSKGILTKYYNISYRDTQENIQRQQEELEQAAEQALTWVEPSMSDMEKALAIHDYLVLNCEYDQMRLQNGSVPAYSHSAYGALVSKIAVCDGYSHAYAYILNDKLGIPCEMVTSESMNHAWSMVSIDGAWYHVDVTWDDPVWDCIGRVRHNYFLLSDNVISDSSHKHANWSAGHTAVSDAYKQSFWTGVQSAFCYWRGDWYYAKYNGTSRTADVVKKQELLGSVEETVYSERSLWGNYGGSFMYLDMDSRKNRIYFNTGTALCRLEEKQTAEIVYEPELSAGQYIFGFTIKENQLCYWVQGTPNLSGNQSILNYPLPEPPLSQITGISAENLTAVYDGKAQKIQVKGTRDGDVVSYAGESGVFGSEQPEMINAGTYQVAYKVERNGWEPFFGKAQVVIEKAKPKYSIPVGLKGNSGSSLREVKLPEGFAWETGDARLREEGTFTWQAQYVPEDTANYETVSHLEVEVTVSCPGHQYTIETLKEPTDMENGQERHTCSICGDTFTREITGHSPSPEATPTPSPSKPATTPTPSPSEPSPETTPTPSSSKPATTPTPFPSEPSASIEGITAEDVKTVYDGMSKRIAVKGTLPGDNVLYADETGAYFAAQPEWKDAGIYQVKYKVEREGCSPFYGEASLEIQKAVPSYTVPVGLKGSSGMAVTDISLPEGFVWQTAAGTMMSKEGTFTYYVKYAPEDARNYLTVSGIAVKVAVSCPGHQYTLNAARKATKTKKGQEIYVCGICGSTYTKELTLPALEKPGKVAGLKLEKTAANSLKFSWNKEEGVNYRLVLYQENKIIDAMDTSGDSCAFTGLKPSVSYALKVRPYRETDGRRIYGDSDGIIEAMTNPAKVKLLSVKKQGVSKAKITWKKAAGADGYEIFMRTGKSKYKKIKTIAKVKTVTFTKSGLKKGKSYSFRIRAYKKSEGRKVYGSYSNVKTWKIK